MASAFNVSGPTPVQILVPGGSYTELGITSANFRPRYRIDVQNEEIRADDTGNEIADMVYTGLVATLSFVLSKWDTAVHASLLSNMPGGAAEAEHGVIGSLWRADSYLIGVRFEPSMSSKERFTFASCVPLVIEETEFGNTAKALACEFQVLRTQDSAGTNASTDNLYVTATTS